MKRLPEKGLFASLLLPEGNPEWHPLGTLISHPRHHAGKGCECMEVHTSLPCIRTSSGVNWIPVGDHQDLAVALAAIRSNDMVISSIRQCIRELQLIENALQEARRMVPLNESIYKPVRVAFCESGHEYAYTSFGLGKNFEVRNRVFALRRLDSVPRDLSHGLFSKFPIC